MTAPHILHSKNSDKIAVCVFIRDRYNWSYAMISYSLNLHIEYRNRPGPST